MDHLDNRADQVHQGRQESVVHQEPVGHQDVLDPLGLVVLADRGEKTEDQVQPALQAVMAGEARPDQEDNLANQEHLELQVYQDPQAHLDPEESEARAEVPEGWEARVDPDDLGLQAREENPERTVVLDHRVPLDCPDRVDLAVSPA